MGHQASRRHPGPGPYFRWRTARARPIIGTPSWRRVRADRLSVPEAARLHILRSSASNAASRWAWSTAFSLSLAFFFGLGRRVRSFSAAPEEQSRGRTHAQ